MEKESLLKLVNGSGFLFQMRVEDDVLKSCRGHRWDVIASEHRWVDRVSGDEKFIDLVLGFGSDRIVVECKRVRDGYWVFLVPSDDPDPVLRVRLLETRCRPKLPTQLDWVDANVDASSLRSSFCIVPGQGPRDRPMLERVAGELLRSAEYLAVEELAIGPEPEPLLHRFYCPLIVTNAQLMVCKVDRAKIDQGGMLALENSSFEEVKYIRFHKSLSTTQERSSPPSTLAGANKEALRTVFIVQASHLPNFLRKWEVSWCASQNVPPFH